MNDIFILLIIFFGVAVFVYILSKENPKGTNLLKEWAERNKYQLISSQFYPHIFTPFFFSSSKLQTVYKVKITDENGHKKEGWVRLGSPWSGLSKDKFKVIWKGE